MAAPATTPDSGVGQTLADGAASPSSVDAGAPIDAALVDAIPPAKVILRAKEINADRVRAKLVFAKSVVAAEGKVGELIETNEATWDDERADGLITLQEIAADEIYVKDLRCRRIEANQVRAKQATIVVR